MFRVLAVINLLGTFLVVSTYVNAKDLVTSQSKNEDIVFRVVNGIPAQLGTIPYQVSIKLPINSHQYVNFCGGSVIAVDKILSAAHCFTSDGNICETACKVYKIKDVVNTYAVAGTLRNFASYMSDEEGTEQWRKLTKVLIPKGFWFPDRDISIAFTAAPFVFNQYVKPLPLASRHIEYGSADCLVSGYGRINSRIASDILLWAKLRLMPSNICSRVHGKSMGNFICTRSDVTNVLEGDSGGPLVCRNTGDPNDRGEGVIVGVVSGARIRPNGYYDTFFTRVSSYRSFYSGNQATISLPVFYIFCLSLIISNFG